MCKQTRNYVSDLLSQLAKPPERFFFGDFAWRCVCSFFLLQQNWSTDWNISVMSSKTRMIPYFSFSWSVYLKITRWKRKITPIYPVLCFVIFFGTFLEEDSSEEAKADGKEMNISMDYHSSFVSGT